MIHTMKKSSSLFVCVLTCMWALISAGCSLQTGTLTRVPEAQFSFRGATANARVVIDDESPKTLTDSPANIAAKPGKHRIRVIKDGAVVVDREVLIGDQQIFEIIVPE